MTSWLTVDGGGVVCDCVHTVVLGTDRPTRAPFTLLFLGINLAQNGLLSV